MSSIIELNKIRYKRPLIALKENAIGKVFLSVIVFVYISIMDLINGLGDILNTPAELIALLLIAIIGDIITGTLRAKRSGNYIRSIGLRQTFVKLLEYSVGLIVLAGIANVFGSNTLEGWIGDLLRLLRNIHWLGYLYATLTELKSIAENTSGEEGRLSRIIDKIDEILGRKDNMP